MGAYILSLLYSRPLSRDSKCVSACQRTLCHFDNAKVETISESYNSRHTHSETVRKHSRGIRKKLRKTAYFRPFIRLKKRFTMLFLRMVS
jgi:hypothetical protein